MHGDHIIRNIEIIKRRATKLIPELRNRSYEKCLIDVSHEKCPSRDQNIRGDQTMFIILNGHKDIDITIVFKLKEGIITWWCKVTLVKEQCR